MTVSATTSSASSQSSAAPLASSRGPRVYDKRQSCLFCGRLQTKISSHLLNCHLDQPDVLEVNSVRILDDDSHEVRKEKAARRRVMFELLRNRGNYEHNLRAKDSGDIIVVRRPEEGAPIIAADYGPCPGCFGYYMISDLSKHMSYRCVGNPNGQRKSQATLRLESERLRRGAQCSKLSPELEEVFNGMQDDAIRSIAKADELIRELGEEWIHKTDRLTGRSTQRHFVSQKMRECARLIELLRKVKPEYESFYMTDFIKPALLPTILECLNTSDPKAAFAPSTVLKIGEDLDAIASIKSTNAIMANDAISRQQADDFIYIKGKKWGTRVASKAHHALKVRRFNRVTELPTTADLDLLNQYIASQIQDVSQKLEATDGDMCQTFKTAQELVLVRLLTFNKRRPAEVETLR